MASRTGEEHHHEASASSVISTQTVHHQQDKGRSRAPTNSSTSSALMVTAGPGPITVQAITQHKHIYVFVLSRAARAQLMRARACTRNTYMCCVVGFALP